MFTKSTSRCFLLLLATVGLSAPAGAVPLFEAFTFFGTSQSDDDPVVTTGRHESISATSTDIREGAARAGPGYIGVYAQQIFSRSGETSGDLSLFHFSSALMRITDLVFTGPAGVDDVDTSLNLLVSGSIDTTAVHSLADPDQQVSAGGAAGFSLQISDNSLNLRHAVTVENQVSPTAIHQVESEGAFGDADFAGNGYDLDCIGSCYSTHVFNVPLNVPLVLSMDLSATAGVTIDGGIRAEGRSIVGFLETISFPTIGSVFNLPDGYSVNSLEGMIANNVWTGAPVVDPDPDPEPVPVPAPGTLALLVAAFAGLGAFRRTRRRAG